MALPSFPGFPISFQHAEQGLEPWSDALDFQLMRRRQSLQDFVSPGGEGDVNLPAIFRANLSRKKIVGRQPIHEANGAVMRHLKPFGEFPDGDTVLAGKTLHGQQRLVLARRQSRLPGRFFAEVQKAAKLITKCRQHFEFRLGHRG
jgi:hypothetical protein